MDKIKYLTVSETERLFKKIKEKGSIRDYTAFNLMYYLGLRASEVGNIKIGDFKEYSGQIYVSRLKGSNCSVRRLDSKRIKILKSYLMTRKDKHNSNSPMFISRNGNGISRYRLDQLIKKYAKMARIPDDKRHCHVLKHSICVHLAEGDFDLKEIQWALGHKNISSTLHYFAFSPRQQDSFHNKFKSRSEFFA